MANGVARSRKAVIRRGLAVSQVHGHKKRTLYPGVSMADNANEPGSTTAVKAGAAVSGHSGSPVLLRIEQAGGSADDSDPPSKFQVWIGNADKVVSLLLKGGLLLIALLATVIVATTCISAMRGGIVVGHFVNLAGGADEEKELAPILMNYLANEQTRTTNIAPLLSEAAETTKIKLQLGGADLPVDEVMKVLQSTFSSAPHCDGTIYKLDDRWGANVRMNGVTLPGGHETRSNLRDIVKLAGDRIIAATQPILFAEMVVNQSIDDDNDIRQLQDALRLLTALKSFYGEDLRAQALVAESNVLQALGDLPGSIKLLSKAAANDRNALLESELALRAHFSSDVGLALQYAQQANGHWDWDTRQVISSEGLRAMRARNRELIARHKGNFSAAKDASTEYADYEASAYDALDWRWESVLHLLKAGAFADADYLAHTLATSAPSGLGDGSRMYVEGPAEYNMTLAIMRSEWSTALNNAVLADKIHLCQEPTKLYQRASVHKPWIDFLSAKAGRKNTATDIYPTPFNNDDRCYRCLRLRAHTLLHQAGAAQGEAREALIRQALQLFDKAIDLAGEAPFAYLERGLSRSLLRAQKDSQQWKQDLRQAQLHGPSWGPVNLYLQSHQNTPIATPADVFNWSDASAGLVTSSEKRTELFGTTYISEAKISEVIQQCMNDRTANATLHPSARRSNKQLTVAP